MDSCCQNDSKEKVKRQIDYFFWSTLIIILLASFFTYFFPNLFNQIEYLNSFNLAVFDIVQEMIIGLLVAIFFVGFISTIPNKIIMKIMGEGGTFKGILRATLAGVLLDLCSHGILLVGMKLYKKGLSLGQTMAFLIASPWNSLSLTFILWDLIGFKWMISFLLLSLVIAVISGLIFDKLVGKKVLIKNPYDKERISEKSVWKLIKEEKVFKNLKLKKILMLPINGFKESKMILRWLFLGVILASVIRTFVTPENFESLVGASVAGLGITLFAATLIEVCSEGSTPIAADILNIGGAPGNSFAFLLTGVSTDYTEIVALKETTKSWKISFFLPLITLPQIVILAVILNGV